MTKKHFKAFAAEINAKMQIAANSTNKNSFDINEAEFACDMVCKIASQDNPRFDEARFRAACGL